MRSWLRFVILSICQAAKRRHCVDDGLFFAQGERPAAVEEFLRVPKSKTPDKPFTVFNSRRSWYAVEKGVRRFVRRFLFKIRQSNSMAGMIKQAGLNSLSVMRTEKGVNVRHDVPLPFRRRLPKRMHVDNALRVRQNDISIRAKTEV